MLMESVKAKELTFYCLRCNRSHPQSDKILVTTKGGQKRWSCIHRINAEKKAKAERDAFGKSVTERNKALAIEIAKSYQNEHLYKR